MNIFKFSTPERPRRLLIQPSATSPFCTSPSQLQEMTLDPDATNFSYIGMRSPGAPFNGGRSVKEIDEQMTNLRKENFNLKLRIYFLEERMGANFNTDKEDAVKKNIELMVELENVRKELEDKQELLCQAAKAIEIEEDEKQRELALRDQKISELNNLLNSGDHNAMHEHLMTDINHSQTIDNVTSNIIKKLQNKIIDLQTMLKSEKERANHFYNTDELTECPQIKCQTLESLLEQKNNKIGDLMFDVEQSENKIIAFGERVCNLQKELDKKESELQNTVIDLQEKDHCLQEQDIQIHKMTKIIEDSQKQFEQQEKKIEKYKLMLTQVESKNDEMKVYIDNLKSKIQNLEVRLETALDEVNNKSTCSELALSLEKITESNNTDADLFSVRNPTSSESPKSKFSSSQSKISSKSLKSNRSTSQNKLNSPKQSKSTNKLSSDRLSPISDSAVSNSSEINDIPLTREELLELKRNHYKACKIIKTMIQKKNEYVEQISHLQSLITEKGNEIESLKCKVTELVECNNNLNMVEKKKTIQEKVSEMNITAKAVPMDNKENSMAAEEMHLAEQYKELANELENKIEILSATLHEKDNQLSRLKIDLEARSNQIVDLEFEILALTQGVTQSINKSECIHNSSIEELSKEKLEKEQLIEKLECELKKRTCDLQGIVNKELWEKNRSIEKMQISLKNKDEEIIKLQKDNYEKEIQLNTLKNKINELGIEDETLNLFCTDSNNLQEHLNIFLEKRTKLLTEIEDLQFKLENVSNIKETNDLQCKYNELQIKFENSKKVIQEKEEICVILSTRLEELCHFLNALLKQKCVLGFLGVEQTKKLQTVLNKSLDLSSTLSMTINNDKSLLELTNITNFLNTSVNDSYNLNESISVPEFSIISSDITLTYQNHFSKVNNNEQSKIIDILRNQIADLKREIELRDVELEKKLNNNEDDEIFTRVDSAGAESSKLHATSSTLVAEKIDATKNINAIKNSNFENNSESESWSEPDRNVSLARIGLNDDTLKKPLTLSKRKLIGNGNLSADSTEEEHGSFNKNKTPKKNSWTESRQTVISLHEQVCDFEIKLKDKENQLLAAQVAFYETENLLKDHQEKLKEANQEKIELNTKLDELSKELEQTEELEIEYQKLLLKEKESAQKLKIAEQEKAYAEEKITELGIVIKTLEDFKKNFETSMDIKNKEMLNTINKMEIEKSKAVADAQKAEELLEKAKADIFVAEDQLRNMHQREDLIRQEFEIIYKNNMKEVEEHYSAKLKNIAKDYEIQASKCKEAVNQIKDCFERDYIKKSEVEKRTLEVEMITSEIGKLKRIINESENKMRMMEVREVELKNKVQDLQIEHQNKLYGLHKDLDNSTLQYSEAILEKTRIKNEYNVLEQKLQSVCIKENELISKVNDLQKELHDVQITLKSQISQLEQQKRTLELKIGNLDSVNSDLQATNAELHNRLIKLQVNNVKDLSFSISLPNSPSNRTLQTVFSRQFSDHSGYASEDVHSADIREKTHTSEAIDIDRVAANSSPDLGIESDQGRFSSLEVQPKVSRPLLPTLELTKSMSDLLDPIQDINCCNERCCKKTKEITNENVELRKRLLRTRRALEETLNRLTFANKQKKEVEKSICKQIHQTSQVLRKAKANLDSGSETDLKN